jgi:hypothetical protein
VIAVPQLYLAFENMVAAPEKLAETYMLTIKVHESPGALPVRIVICNNNTTFPGLIQSELFEGNVDTPPFDFEIIRPKYSLSGYATF